MREAGGKTTRRPERAFGAALTHCLNAAVLEARISYPLVRLTLRNASPIIASRRGPGLRLRFQASTGPTRADSRRDTTDHARQLRWLSAQIGPGGPGAGAASVDPRHPP